MPIVDYQPGTSAGSEKSFINDVDLLSLAVRWVCLLCGALFCFSAPASARVVLQDEPAESPLEIGYQVDVPLPINSQAAEDVCVQLDRLAQKIGADNQRRTTVVIKFVESEVDSEQGGGATLDDGRGSEFEAALRIARCITGRVARQLKTVSYIDSELRGHAVLVALACDELIVGPEANMGEPTIDEAKPDLAIQAVYESIAEIRAIVPQPVIAALVDPGQALYRVTLLSGAERFVGEAEAEALRTEGQIVKEEKLSDAGRPLSFNGQKLREYRWASATVNSRQELATQLGLARIIQPDSVAVAVKAVRMDLRGPVNGGRVRRFRSNLAAAFDSRTANSVFVEIDSPGGSLNASLELGLELAQIGTETGESIGYVIGESRGDAVLVSTGCKPLYLHPEARLGGSGAAAISKDEITDLQEAISQLANLTGRSPALLIGLLDPSIEVYRYVQRRTGQIAYYSDLDPPDDVEQWEQTNRIMLEDGLSAAEAIELGLAEGEADSGVLAAQKAGLDDYPPPLSDRRIVHLVERLGGLPWLGPLLIFIGFTTFSMEMSAPGLGLPGFVALICFMFFFWMKFLSGTAEWLEVVLFLGGAVCILLELFVIPGLGVFGIGGLLMIISSILLMSQTFVIPQNTYQYRQTTSALLTVLAACTGVVSGLIALRYLLPGTPMFRHLVMPGPNSPEMAEQEQREHIVRYDDLIGQSGVATTPLRPAGKAQFGEQIVAVVSDGSALGVGEAVRVIEVHGNRIVVEPV